MSLESDLAIARALIDAGIPVFAAPPCPGATCTRERHRNGKTEYDLPPKWQMTVPSHVWLERWQPGWALGMVCGVRESGGVDGIDVDPRSGGDGSFEEIRRAGHLPRVFGVQETPSGGWHHLIAPLGERETNRFMPGLDYQGGDAGGQGRAFLWIAPTLKRSKAVETMGEIRPYRWIEAPDLELLAEFQGSDDTGEDLRARILSRQAKGDSGAPDKAREGADGAGDSGLFGGARKAEERLFTEDEAQQFCSITLDRLEKAQIGEIEECANAAAVQLSHFVPSFWTAEFAFSVLMQALNKTAYDPNGPSNWTAEKFRDVIARPGGETPSDWVAIRRETAGGAAEIATDEVDALLAEMLTASQLKARPRPKPLVKGVLNLDSESWLIGPPGSKKSFVALDIAGAVASGRPWQGHAVHTGAVVMVVAEGAGGTGARIEAYERLHGPMPDGVHFLPRPVQAADQRAWRVLVEACRRLEPVLVVIDTQARSTVGLDENSAKEMGIYIEAVRAAREATGACILSVHHTGRKGGDARGSSAIDGAQHTELKVESEAGSLRGVLRTEKQKDMAMGADVPLVFEVVQTGVDDDGDPVTSLAVVADAFRAASGLFDRPEVEEWERWHGQAQIHLLKVLRDQGGSIGLTKAESRSAVVDRFYGKDGKRLARSTWASAWTRVLELRAPDGSPVVVAAGGARFMLDQLAFEALNQGRSDASEEA